MKRERLAYLNALITALGLAAVVGRGFALRLRRRVA
jgi:hypothetical protein